MKQVDYIGHLCSVNVNVGTKPGTPSEPEGINLSTLHIEEVREFTTFDKTSVPDTSYRITLA